MKTKGLAALLWIATMAVFWQAHAFKFFELDDGPHIYESSPVDPPSWDGLATIWATPRDGLYIPVTYSVWTAETALARRFGMNSAEGYPDPRFFHLGNVLLHATNVALVFLILETLFQGTAWAALLGAACFAFHPVQVEPVAWVSGLKDLLSAFFALLCILIIVRSIVASRAATGQTPGERPLLRYAAAFVFFLLALLSKPSVVALPLALIALEAGLLRRPLKGALLRFLPWLIPAACLTYLTHAVQPASVGGLSWGLRLRVALDSLGFYASKYAFPGTILPDYGRSPRFVLEHGSYWFCVLPLALLGLAAADKNRRFWLSALAVYLGAGMATTLGLIPFEFQFLSTVADRYGYLSLLGISLLLGGFSLRWRKTWVRGALAGFVLVCLGRTLWQLPNWKDTDTLLSYTLEQRPESALARGLLGSHHLAGGSNEGIAEIQSLLELVPDWSFLRFQLAHKLGDLKRYDEAEAQYRELARRKPDHQGVQWDLAQLEMERGRPAQAIEPLKRVTDPNVSTAVTNALAVAYFESGEVAAALKTFAEGAEKYPTHTEILLNYAAALERSGREAEALDLYRKLLARSPQPAARERIARLLAKRGQWSEAAEQYRKLILFSGASPDRLVWLADALLRSGRSQDAVDSYEEALELDPKYQPAIQALASARAGRSIACSIPSGANGWVEAPSG